MRAMPWPCHSRPTGLMPPPSLVGTAMAVMALVLFFVPYPAKGFAEMARVVRPGGTVAAYLWRLTATPPAPFTAELRDLRATTARPVSAETTQMEALPARWTDAGLEAVETREI